MSDHSTDPSATVLDAMVRSIRGCAAFDKNDLAAPVAVLWPDEERAWLDVLPRLRAAMPELLTLGAFDASTRTGPALWIKAMLAHSETGSRLLAEANWPDGLVPVVYMPGVGRQTIRSLREAPPAVKPLCELQFRGTMWTQLNAKDWTPRAFLQSEEGGLGLSLATDKATLEAMRQALLKLADVPVSRLKGRTLDAGDFHDLLSPDPDRTVLDWLSDATGFKAAAGATWTAFRTICKDKFGFDPEKTDVTRAGQLLAERQGPWSAVWNRFEENPALYPGIRDVLRRSKPGNADSLFGDASISVYPQDVEAGERELRQDLAAVGSMPEVNARSRLLELESRHGARRRTVWARLGEAPLATALKHLADLAERTATTLSGADRTAAAERYAESGWMVDAAAMAALAVPKATGDLEAVGAAVKAVYGPWLDKSARAFQKLVEASPLPGAEAADVPRIEPGTCMVFADGLRMDLGRRLMDELTRRGLTVSFGWRWSTVPSVTATAKPAASPVASLLNATSEPNDFVPSIASDGKSLTAERFRALLSEHRVDPLTSRAPGDSTRSGWVEAGTIDQRGHSEGMRLASLLADEVRLMADRVADLLGDGWGHVRVVTDHGWLLLPGGLPKVSIPKFLVETNWRRCAQVKAGATPEVQLHGWHWNPAVSIALAPGIACFREGAEYAHGGLSVQECVTPVLTVTKGAASGTAGVSIESVTWTQLAARVQIAGTGAAAVDLRRDSADPSSSLLESGGPRAVDGSGKARIYARDDCDGHEAEVVALDGEGRVMARRRTHVGKE
jgi:hypothetical protein